MKIGLSLSKNGEAEIGCSSKIPINPTGCVVIVKTGAFEDNVPPPPKLDWFQNLENIGAIFGANANIEQPFVKCISNSPQDLKKLKDMIRAVIVRTIEVSEEDPLGQVDRSRIRIGVVKPLDEDLGYSICLSLLEFMLADPWKPRFEL